MKYFTNNITKDLVKLDRFNEHVLLVKERTLLELIFTKAPLMQWTNAFYRQITANHSPNWLSSRALGINLYQFHCLQSPFTAAHSPWTSRQQPETSRETPWNHPWTTREPPVNHPGTTREPPVNHPWDQCVGDTKTGLETRKTDFVPWATRETPVKHPWSIREAPVNDPGTLNEHALTGKWFPSFCRFPISNAVCHSTICMSLWTKSLSR